MEGMDALIVVGLIVFFLFSAYSKAKQRAAGNATEQHETENEKATDHKAAAQSASTSARKVNFRQAAQAAARGERLAQAPLNGSLGEYQPMQSTMTEGQSNYSTITHRLEELGEYQGSMGGHSTEGEDLCDSSLHHEGPRFATESIYENELTETAPAHLNAVAQGFVMSEILMHPSQRKWGKR
ncbi:MAG: hypothetical protein RR065_10295 [Clostridia bacterium]